MYANRNGLKTKKILHAICMCSVSLSPSFLDVICIFWVSHLDVWTYLPISLDIFWTILPRFEIISMIKVIPNRHLRNSK
jgi:hypothetical protein